jgi:hypothetical protein
LDMQIDGRRGAKEPFEQVLLLIERDPHAMVLDLDGALGGPGQDPDTDSPSVMVAVRPAESS